MRDSDGEANGTILNRHTGAALGLIVGIILGSLLVKIASPSARGAGPPGVAGGFSGAG